MGRDNKILGAIWYTPPYNGLLSPGQNPPIIGIIAIESYAPAGHWKCYIGFGAGHDELLDALAIAKRGMPLANKEAAHGFFPQLDLEGYQY